MMKLILPEKVVEKLRYTANHFDDEFVVFLTAELKDGNIRVGNDIMCPFQSVSTSELGVTGDNLFKMRGEYGDKCQNINVHLHSHGHGKVFWSQQDKKQQQLFQQNKEWCVFVVINSLNNMKALLHIGGEWNVEIDDLPIEIETIPKKQTVEFFEGLKSKIIVEPKFISSPFFSKDKHPMDVIFGSKGFNSYAQNFWEDDDYYMVDKYSSEWAKSDGGSSESKIESIVENKDKQKGWKIVHKFAEQKIVVENLESSRLEMLSNYLDKKNLSYVVYGDYDSNMFSVEIEFPNLGSKENNDVIMEISSLFSKRA